MVRLFDLILSFLERVLGLSWGKWDADDRPDLVLDEWPMTVWPITAIGEFTAHSLERRYMVVKVF